MRARRIGGGVVWAAAMMISWASAAWAAEGGSSRIDGMLHKLGRGIANVVTCPAELIRTPEFVSRREGYLAGMSAGILQGAWRMLQRGVVGLFEVATFYAEIPKDYGPLMKPEFVYVHGGWVE